MSKFVVTIEHGTKEQQDAITALLNSKGWSVWHWLEDLWLITGVPPDVGPKSITEAIKAAVPSLVRKRHLVMKIDGDVSFWGGVTSEAWPWMNTNWGTVSTD